MGIRKHLTLLAVGILGWLFFYLVGLPSDYFIEWSLTDQILISMITFFSVIPVVGGLELLFLGGDYFKTALWAAFYASVPVFILDYIVVGVIRGEGFHFLITHWYITIAYFYVWIELPLIGLALQKITRSSAANG